MAGLSGARPELIVRHLPLIFDIIIQLLVQPPRISGHTLNIGHNCFEALCILLENISVIILITYTFDLLIKQFLESARVTS